MGGNQGRIRDMVSSAKEIWKDDPDVCDAWLKVVFNDSKTELNRYFLIFWTSLKMRLSVIIPVFTDRKNTFFQT